MPQRALKTRTPVSIPARLQMQIPSDEYDELKQVVARLRRRRANKESKLTKDPSEAKIVRLALQKLFTLTIEQLEENLEEAEL